MAQSIKLADDIMDMVRRESRLHSRSIAGQIAHWLKIGQAVENSGRFNHARISQVLEGASPTTILSDEEKAVWLDRFVEQMHQPSPEEELAFAQRRQLGLGVGLDPNGNLVYADDEPRTAPI